MRLQDINFERLSLTVRDGKANKDRQTLFSERLVGALQDQVARACEITAADAKVNVGVSLPFALHRKYPTALFSPSRAFMFPSQFVLG